MAIIEVKNLGKKYRIGERERYLALRDVLAGIIKSPARWLKDKVRSWHGQEYWALKDVNFSVEKGEVLGIIGRNGAGKSTLLKILSQITPPTTGEIHLGGRVGSLLEVGTGFHPELTGRENIYLNGAILGMKKKEIDAKFDQIVDFSGIGEFLDTPVKRYSSGMYVRLAFSVAAHLEPDILIIDEVLAVGDAEFQKKCLGKMEEVAKTEGRTVLFVSHNMEAVKQLCGRVAWLDKGRVIKTSNDVYGVVNEYLNLQNNSVSGGVWKNENTEFRHDLFTPLSFSLVDESGTSVGVPWNRKNKLSVKVSFDVKTVHPDLLFGYVLYDEMGNVVYWTFQNDSIKEHWPQIKAGNNVMISRIPIEYLNEGRYTLELIATVHNSFWIISPASGKVTINLQIFGFSGSVYWPTKRYGVMAPVIVWENQ